MSRYIDAEEVEKRIDVVIGSEPKAWDKKALKELKMYVVHAVPTADVRENVKGEWIEDNPREKSMMWRCSVCGRIAYYPIIGERKSYKKHCGYNFCPNCGADMRREDNGRDEENHNRV